MTGSERISLDDETARDTIQHLEVYAARRRADGAESEADQIDRLAAEIRHKADSNLRDCGNCGWVGTYLGDVADGPPVICPLCGWKWVYTGVES